MRKLARIALIGMGAAAIVSGIVNIMATYRLIDAAEELSLGVTRGELAMAYSGILVVGVAMVVCGFLVRPRNIPPKL